MRALYAAHGFVRTDERLNGLLFLGRGAGLSMKRLYRMTFFS
jgi:hypothetical protein